MGTVGCPGVASTPPSLSGVGMHFHVGRSHASRAARAYALAIETAAASVQALEAAASSTSSLPQSSSSSSSAEQLSRVLSSEGVLHRVLLGPADTSLERALTHCGWRFARARVAMHTASTHVHYKKLCARCFPEQRLAKAEFQAACRAADSQCT